MEPINSTFKEKKTVSAWTSTTQVYDFFSVFLQRGVLTATSLNLSFVPIEYCHQITECKQTEDGIGYLNLLMMLFTEHFQKNITGTQKLYLPEQKYKLMCDQFIYFFQLELLRREEKIKSLKEENLFNPNLKTEFYINDACKLSLTDLQDKCKQLNVYLHLN